MLLYLFSLLILSFLFEGDQWMILKMKYVVTVFVFCVDLVIRMIDTCSQ